MARLINTNTPTEAQVRGAYRSIGRTNVDAAGLAYWMGQDASQLDRNFGTAAATVGAAATSTARNQASIDDVGYARATGQGAIEGATSNPNNQALYASPKEVQQNYTNLFNRTADTAGADYWAKSGLMGADLTNAMKASADQIAATAPKVAGTGISNYKPGGVNFDVNGNPVTAPAPAFADSAPAVTGTTDTGPVAKATASTAATAAPVAAEKAVASSYVADKATAANWDVKAPQTVQSQVESIIAKNSPLQQQAEGLATQRTNARGLINTGMGIETGMNALYANALPMAQQDASTFARAGEFNAGAQQQVNMANAGYSNSSMQFNAAGAMDISKTNVSNALQAGIVNQAQANEISKFNANLLTTVDLSNVRDANQFQQFALDQAFKAKIINQEQYNAMSRFNTGIAADRATATALAGAATGRDSAAELAAKNAATALAGVNTTTAAAQQINDLAKLDKSIAGQVTLADIQAAASRDNAQASASATLSAAQSNAATSRENNAATIAANLVTTKLNNQYGQLAQSSTSATSILNNTASSIAKIVQDTELSAEAKTVGINRINNQAQAGLTIVGNLGGDLDFGNFAASVFLETPTPAPTTAPG